jgi:serine/threonine-protein kinase
MQIATAEFLIQALRASGLFTPDQLQGMLRELTPLGDGTPALLQRILEREWLTLYQLRKVLHGKAAELHLGPYVLTDKVGEGGMGKVYRAVRVRDGEAVALKIVRPILLANPVIRRRYDREVSTALSLNHPNIVAVSDAGEVDGRYYLAMEFVDGIDLSRLVREYSPLEIPEACEYARQAALGLQHAHEAGFVHRDIKPSNILVAGERHVPEATEPAVVKIVDMGLIRAVELDDDVNPDLTRDGAVVGTPDYMAPEQAKNSSAVDHRADLYSLGCTLYFLLAGRPPFRDGTAIEKILKHQFDAPLPIQALRREVPTPLAELVARLLAKKPQDRLPSARAVADALAPMARYAAGSQPVALPPRDGPPAAPQAAVTSPGAARANGSGTSKRSASRSVAPSDPTPRPTGLTGPLHAAVETSPFASLTDPPSGVFPPVAGPRSRELRQPVSLWRRWKWPLIAAGVVLLATGVGLWAAFGTGGGKQQSAQPETPVTPDEPAVRPPVKPGLVPSVNLARFNPQLSLIPDGAAMVVVAYPETYLREKDSPFAKGPGPGRLVQWANRITADTAFSLPQSDRVILSVPAAEPERYLLASEGDYLTPKFAADLEKNSKLRPLTPPKGARPIKLYAASGTRQTALLTPAPPGPPVYFLGSGAGTLPKYIPRGILSGKTTNPELPAEMLSALNAATETPPPLLVAVVGPEMRLPFGRKPTLRGLGIDLLTARVRIGDTLELEVAVSGPDATAVRQFPDTLAQLVREDHPLTGRALAEMLTRAERSQEERGGAHRLTLKIHFTPEQWSAFLERLV